MLQTKVPADIRKYTPHLFFGLSTRQALTLVAVVGLGYLMYKLTHSYDVTFYTIAVVGFVGFSTTATTIARNVIKYIFTPKRYYLVQNFEYMRYIINKEAEYVFKERANKEKENSKESF